MWKNVKIFFLGVLSGCAAVFSFVFRRKLLRNGDPASTVEADISAAESEAGRAEENNRAAEDLNRELTELAEDGSELIRTIREQKLP
jgi:hypothetical protein